MPCAKSEHRMGPVFDRKLFPFQQVLVNPDGAINLAPAPEQIAQRKMGRDRFAIHFRDSQKYFERFVRLLVEQEIEAL